MDTGVSVAWYKKPWAIVRMFAVFILLVLVGSFVYQVAINVKLLRSGGEDVITKEANERARATLASRFANPEVTADDLKNLERGIQPTIGDPKAPVHLVEFIDFQCPFCRALDPTLLSFVRAHPKDVYLVLRDFPLAEIHPDAEMAAIAARCVFTQGNMPRYWVFHDALFAQADRGFTEGKLIEMATSVGVSQSLFEQCLATRATSETLKRGLEDGIRAGVAGTPTLFVNGVQFQGVLERDELEKIVKAALERARAK